MPDATFIHSCYTCSKSSFEQRQPIPNATDTPNNKLIKPTNKDNFLPG
jgi:hypothetical protein